MHGHLPPAVVYGPDQTPLLSWRVLLLPYIEEQALFEEFHLGEPWDSPHNLRLLGRMPAAYAPPGRKKAVVPPHHTVVHVFVGPGTAFEERRQLKLSRDDFPDGLSTTLLFVEAGEPVPWTQPADLGYDPAGPLPPLPGFSRDGFRACHADAARTWFRSDTPEAELRAAITRNGREGPP